MPGDFGWLSECMDVGGLDPGAPRDRAILVGCTETKQVQARYGPGQSHSSPCRLHPGQRAGAVVAVVWRQSQGSRLVRQLKLKRFHSRQLGALCGASALAGQLKFK